MHTLELDTCSAKFKIGDAVRIIKLDDNITSRALIGLIGIVSDIDHLPNNSHNYYVNSHYMHEQELELVTSS